MKMKNSLLQLAKDLEGELYHDELWKTIYATDASVYREIPLAVSIPKSKQDLIRLIRSCFDFGMLPVSEISR